MVIANLLRRKTFWHRSFDNTARSRRTFTLWLLEPAGLITLNPAADKWTATQKNIVANPKHLKFTLLDFAAQSRSLPDLAAAVGYTEYYLAAKAPISQQIFAPPAPDEFAGQLTIGSKWADTENIKNLVATFQDPAVQRFLATDPSVKNILLPLQRRQDLKGDRAITLRSCAAHLC
jgi:D-methionine transport system substrate-binding protein